MTKSILTFIVSTSVAVAGCVSPAPTSWAVKKLIESAPLATPPLDYAQIQDNVAVWPNLSYPSQYENNVYDVYVPHTVKPGTQLPVLIWVHGGAFVAGDKTDVRYFAPALANQGYMVVAMNYQLAPKAIYPTPLVQIQELYQALLKVAPAHQGNMTQLFFAGDSAGAQMAAQFVAMQTNPQLATAMAMPAVVPKAHIKGVLLYCGPYDLTALKGGTDSGLVNFILNQLGWSYLGNRDWLASDEVQQADVVSHVTADFPPAYITDGNTFSFESHGQALVSALQKKGVAVQSRFFDKAQAVTEHEYQFKMDSEAGQQAFADSVQFLNQYRSR
ncbi:MAG: alpha/beta hydrolase [Neisseriaceae bacterium]|nr:alpha/beta hydrolase [Neisseriaceae bacterium]